MIVDCVTAKLVHKLVEEQGTAALEKTVRMPVRAHTVHDISPVFVGFYHVVHGVYVILAVAVNAYGNVSLGPGFHETCEQSVLVTEVARQTEAAKVLIPFTQRGHNLPGAVGGTVVDKKYAAVGGNLFRCDKAV